MGSFIRLSKVKVFLGENSLTYFPELLRGKKVGLITGKNHLKATNHLERIVSIFESFDIKYTIVSEVEPNPTVENIDFCSELLRDFNPDVLVGFGGGSTMDATKAVSFKLKNPNINIWDYVEERIDVVEHIPTIMIPTTAGTGSEANRYSVITNTKKIQKKSMRVDAGYPEYAFLIPSFTSTMNKYLTATTAIDALSHSIEAMVSKNSNFITESLAEKSIKTIIENIFIVYNNPTNMEARHNMQKAAFLGGLAIDISGVGLMHALEHPITARFSFISHGQGLAIVFRKVVEHSFMFAPEKYKKVAETMGIKTRGSSDMNIMMTLLDSIEYLLTYLGLNKKLSDFGIDKSDIKHLAEDTSTYMSRTLSNSPYVPSRDSIEKILREVY